MPGLGIALFTDEDVHAPLAPALRRLGYDAESCQEAGRSNQRISDEEHLIYSAERGRAILTFNVVDFVALDHRWKAAERAHAGIIVAPEITDFRELLRRVVLHLNTYSAEQQADTLLWLA